MIDKLELARELRRLADKARQLGLSQLPDELQKLARRVLEPEPRAWRRMG